MTDKKNKQTFGLVWENNLYLLKLCFTASPSLIIATILEGIRNPLSIFLEHTLGIGYVLEAAEFHYSFKKVAIYVILLTLVVSLGMIFAVIVGDYIAEKEKPKVYEKVRLMLYEKIKTNDYENYDNPQHYNDMILVMSEADKQVDRCLTFLGTTFSGLTAFITTGAYFICKDKHSIFFVTLSFIMVFVVNLIMSKLNYRLSMEKKLYERKREYIKRVFYMNNYAKEIRLNQNVANGLFDDLSQANKELYGVEKKYAMKMCILRFLGNYVGNDFFSDVLYITYLVIQAAIRKCLSISSVAILYRNFNNLKNGMTVFTNTYPFACETSLYIQRIKEFMQYENHVVSEENMIVEKGEKSIEISNLSFSYGANSKNNLQDISLKINPGEKVALVGYNGAGKTTLVKLIARLYDPKTGEILVNGRNIKKYNIDSYRDSVGVVFQDYKLIAGNVLENICMSSVDKFESEAIKNVSVPMMRSGLWEVVENLPNKLNTQLTTEVSEAGVDLSGGQSQKLAITRVLYKNWGLLILDEPSSALDPIAEYQINKTIMNETDGNTVIIISHRLSTTRLVDRIIMLENGQIVEEGNHDNLLALDGKYAAMWKAQASIYSI